MNELECAQYEGITDESRAVDERKKERSSKARTLTRRLNELKNAVAGEAATVDIEERINTIKYTFEELGAIQDLILDRVAEDDDAYDENVTWYEKYDSAVIQGISAARAYVERKRLGWNRDVFQPIGRSFPSATVANPVKIKKLSIPVFESQPKTYLKWKSTFERYTIDLSDEIKYDYLMQNTKGHAHDYVTNRSTYDEAIEKLDKEYGNKHVIINLLIDDIKSLPMVRKGDFRGFEKLTYEANTFRDRLVEMGCAAESENTYILKELESKLNMDDLQKWLESMGEAVDNRRVEDFVKWLEHQRNLRRISNSSAYKSYSNSNPSSFDELANLNNFGRVSNCGACYKEPHELTSCSVFESWSLNERWEFVKRKRLCFQCLLGNHQRTQCTAPKCDVCVRPHHKLLHNFNGIGPFANVSNSKDETNPPYNNSTACMDTPRISRIVNTGQQFPSRCFLPIVKSTVISEEKEILATTLLDSGSELNVMSSKLCNKLRLTGSPITINVTGVGGEMTQRRTKVVEVIVKDRIGYQTRLQCIVLDKTCGRALRVDPRILTSVDEKYSGSKDEIHLSGGDIDLLIGMPSPHLHQQISLHGNNNGLMIMETRFGPSLVGRGPLTSPSNFECGAFNSNSISIVNEENLLQFVEAETAGIKKECDCQTKTDEELLFDDCMKNAWSNDDTGRFEVKLPWKIDPTILSNNRQEAIARSVNLEKRLSRNPEILKMFNDQVEEMIFSNILKEVDPSYPRRYVPLLAVVDLERESSKVRICLDSKSRYSGLSLNDALLKGKYEMGDIFQIVTRFRSGAVAGVGDIRKMFWQILIDQNDQMYHGVIHKGRTYVFTRLCFGDKPSPPIADMSMVKMAHLGKESHPLASKVLLHNRFMDDVMNANSNMKIMKKTTSEIDDLIGKFGFDIKEWFSNYPEIGTVKKSKKVLGIKWDMENDVLSANVNVSPSKILTKRIILSRIAEVWDILGTCAGVMLLGKVLFQSIVRLQCGWDEIIKNADMQAKWETWLHEINKCDDLAVPRSILPIRKYNEKLYCELVGFSDGSNIGYGCVLYLRWKNSDESVIKVKFVGAKAKVSPIKGNTIPRNELNGALILTRLAWSTLESLKRTELAEYLNESTIKLNSDSTTVLNWIRSPAVNYKPYVKNKIIEIQTLLPSSRWRFVPSNKNKAADLLSRGCGRTELDVIIEGPAILRIPDKEWPKQPECRKSKVDDDEKIALARSGAVTLTEPLLNIERYDSWRKLVRITAYVYKFINKLRRKKLLEQMAEQIAEGDDCYYANPTVDEIRQAETYWIRYAQYQFSGDEKSLEKFVPFTDDSGVKRVTGRLSNSKLFDFDRKHPILLPAKSWISYIILRDIHCELFHPGHNRVLAESRKRFWILNGRRIAKSIGFKCTICRRWRSECSTQLMSDLPWFRIEAGAAPFENVSIDYFGPFLIKYGRNQRIKAYGIIFACLTTRAIHLEMATNLTTDNFLLALRRFISIYGQPKYVRSDNGKNFRGAARELSEMNKRWRLNEEDVNKIKDFVAYYDIKWTFSTPLASHHNGSVESLIKTVKSSLNKIVNERVLSEEEYRTVLSQVQSLVNSRPLWPANEGDVEEPPITCHDLLRPHGLILHPPQLNEGNPKSRYDYIERLTNEWWRLWLRQFVPNLQTRSKWLKVRINIENGDIVLLIDPDIKRGKWKMGKVVKTFPGTDGKVRSVKVKTATGTLDRPITKLCLLVAKNEYDKSVSEEQEGSSRGEK